MNHSYFIGYYCLYYQKMCKELAYEMDEDTICWYDDGTTQFYGNCSLDGEEVTKIVQEVLKLDGADVKNCICNTCGEFTFT